MCTFLKLDINFTYNYFDNFKIGKPQHPHVLKIPQADTSLAYMLSTPVEIFL